MYKFWQRQLDATIEDRIGEVNLTNQDLASATLVSERHLFRRVKEITGLSPQKYLRNYRLKRAMDYMNMGTYTTVKDTAAAVGYCNIGYFTRQFEREYGVKPFQVLRNAGWRGTRIAS